jgi:hypothetical protein
MGTYNLLGKRYWEYKVTKCLYTTTDPLKRKDIVWECTCVCKRKFTATTQELKCKLPSRTIKSCGCKEQQENESNAWIRCVGDYKWNAKKNNREWNLTDSYAIQLLKDSCYYCNSLPARKYQAHGVWIIVGGIDRVDSSQGYILNNVVSCCMICNRMKLDLSKGVFFDQILRIIKNCKLLDLNPRYK